MPPTNGTVTLTANNDYAGGTTVEAGTLTLRGASADAGSNTIAVGANRLTPREYQSRWMAMYARILGAPEQWVDAPTAWTATSTAATCRTECVPVELPFLAGAVCHQPVPL